MHDGVGAPRAPALGALHGLALGDATQGGADAEIGGGERVRPPESAHREVLRGPRADAGQLLEARQRLLDVAGLIERERAFREGTRDGAEAARAGAGKAHRGDAGFTRARERLGAREEPRERREWRRDARAEARREAARERPRAADGDLLAEDGAHRSLEPIPGARHAEAGAARDERPKGPIAGEVPRDGDRIGVQIEERAQPRGDPVERARERAGRLDAQRAPAVLLDRDPAGPGSEADRAAVHAVRHLLHARDGTLRQEREQRRQVVGEAEREVEGESARSSRDDLRVPAPSPRGAGRGSGRGVGSRSRRTHCNSPSPWSSPV